jgi:hypothetical protein
MMSDVEALKTEVKKLSAQAIKAKMDLHDLSEELPLGWQSILDVAARTEDAFRKLEDARLRLKALEAR